MKMSATICTKNRWNAEFRILRQGTGLSRGNKKKKTGTDIYGNERTASEGCHVGCSIEKGKRK